MAFFRVTDDDGEQVVYPAQKVYDDAGLDYYGESRRHFHWEAVTDDDDFLSSDDLPENVEFFEYDEDEDDVALDYAGFYDVPDLEEIDPDDEDDG